MRYNKFKQMVFGADIRLNILLSIIIVLCIVFATLSQAFLSVNNIMNIARQTSVLAIISIGMTFIILTGGIDLSVGSVLALSGAAGVLVLVSTGSSFLGFLVALIVGAACGLCNGVMVGFVNINPFIITLATMVLTRGLTLAFTNAISIHVANPVFLWLGSKSFGPVPIVLVLVLFMYYFFSKFSKDTIYGRWVYAVGGNEHAAKLCGIKTGWVICSVYILTGILAGLGGIITVGRLSSAQPWAGNGLEFDVITAVVLGGTSLQGGEGTLKGTFLGYLV